MITRHTAHALAVSSPAAAKDGKLGKLERVGRMGEKGGLTYKRWNGMGRIDGHKMSQTFLPPTSSFFHPFAKPVAWLVLQ